MHTDLSFLNSNKNEEVCHFNIATVSSSPQSFLQSNANCMTMALKRTSTWLKRTKERKALIGSNYFERLVLSFINLSEKLVLWQKHSKSLHKFMLEITFWYYVCNLVSGFFKALFQSSGRGGKGGRFAKQMQGKVEKLGWPSVWGGPF